MITIYKYFINALIFLRNALYIFVAYKISFVVSIISFLIILSGFLCLYFLSLWSVKFCTMCWNFLIPNNFIRLCVLYFGIISFETSFWNANFMVHPLEIYISMDTRISLYDSKLNLYANCYVYYISGFFSFAVLWYWAILPNR